MADTAITATTLTADSKSANLMVAGGTSVATGDTGVIGGIGNSTNRLVISLYSASGTTVYCEAGDRPPSERAGLGNMTAITLTAGEVYLLPVQGGRYIQRDATDKGKIRIKNSGAQTVVIGAQLLPKTS
jgi:hypothetical protein